MASNTGTCNACGKAHENLKKCSRCHYAEYCSRDCQAVDWKETHKEQCDAAKKLMAKGNSKEETAHLLVMRQMKHRGRELRKHVKAGGQVIFASATHSGMVLPGMPLPEGVPANFSLKQKAVMEFHQRSPSNPLSPKLGNMAGEQQYKDYYDGILELKEEWMTFFAHQENMEHCEHTCGILGTLATIYRHRGTLEQCKNVLDLEDQLLELYERHSRNIGVPAAISCFEGLRYKCLLIRDNLNMQLHQYDANIPIFRSQAKYELQYNVPEDGQNYLFMVEMVLGVKNPTVKSLNRLTEDEIRRMVMAPVQFGVSPDTTDLSKRRVALFNCESCGAQEKAVRQFKACARCGEVYYCGKECQRAHWKSHKRACKGKA